MNVGKIGPNMSTVPEIRKKTKIITITKIAMLITRVRLRQSLSPEEDLCRLSS